MTLGCILLDGIVGVWKRGRCLGVFTGLKPRSGVTNPASRDNGCSEAGHERIVNYDESA
jgi:hypothetical protein